MVQAAGTRSVALVPSKAPTLVLWGAGSSQFSHYQTLKVKPFATVDVIRGAYRRLAREAHPDVNRSADATQQMLAVNEAYAVLRDPARRAEYDRKRLAHALRDAFVGVPTADATHAGPLNLRSHHRRIRHGLRSLRTVLPVLAITLLLFAQRADAEPVNQPADTSGAELNVEISGDLDTALFSDLDEA